MAFDDIGQSHATFTIDGQLGVAFNTNQGLMQKAQDSQISIESQMNIEIEENKVT